MNAQVLILDDALSAVDVQTERKILDALQLYRCVRNNNEQNTPDRITIIVCHRLTAVEHASHIVVLDHGHPAEQGTHQQLLANNRWYARMHRYQQLEQAVLEGH